MCVPVGLLLMSLTIGGITAYLATHDPSFAVVDDYYQKGLDWDQTLAQRKLNRELGWQVSAQVLEGKLEIQIADADAKPLANAELTYSVFHNARAANRIQGVAMAHSTDVGSYQADVPFDRAGIWVIQYRIQIGENLFVDQTRLELK